MKAAPSFGLDYFLFAAWFSSTLFAGFLLFPELIHDPDFYAYKIYWSEIFERTGLLVEWEYFNHPKLLNILLAGIFPTAEMSFVFHCFLSGILPVIIRRISLKGFGIEATWFWLFFLFWEPSRFSLAAQSSADFQLALLLYLGIYAYLCGNTWLASLCFLCGALVKPVASLCGLALVPFTKRWAVGILQGAIPFLGILISVGLHQIFFESWLNPSGFLGKFAEIRGVEGTPFWALPWFVFYTFLAENKWGALSVLGYFGAALWISSERFRLYHPVFSVPLLLVAGYTGLALLGGFMPFFRFFWPVEIWLSGFMAYGIAQAGFFLSQHSRLARAAFFAALIAAAGLALGKAWVRYVTHIATPLSIERRFLMESCDFVATHRKPGEKVSVPLAGAPYLLYKARSPREPNFIVVQELKKGSLPVDWQIIAPGSLLGKGVSQPPVLCPTHQTVWLSGPRGWVIGPKRQETP